MRYLKKQNSKFKSRFKGKQHHKPKQHQATSSKKYQKISKNIKKYQEISMQQERIKKYNTYYILSESPTWPHAKTSLLKAYSLIMSTTIGDKINLSRRQLLEMILESDRKNISRKNPRVYFRKALRILKSPDFKADDLEKCITSAFRKMFPDEVFRPFENITIDYEEENMVDEITSLLGRFTFGGAPARPPARTLALQHPLTLN
jgi:hypothetical protein